MTLPLCLRRFLLRQRIERLRWSIGAATEALDDANGRADGISRYLAESHREIRLLRAQLSLLERPETLVARALQQRGWR